ncbi:LamG-like jellyroll fold domain-containing protein [Candidatus Albibeggiatoa sp. nov. NOAA]|uniref:LamG-like jellyroll fold domain-containing protein n=1 Tax=Candidatus Albibeggiatoa sp. nov. NOAA TaxID=3162724 RepID=UPI0032F5FA98|nr:LamG domain-containing protein [Thiotrichaceae bacterium]
MHFAYLIITIILLLLFSAPSHSAKPIAGFGSAAEFNGTSGYIEVPNSDSLQMTDAITIEAWTKLTQKPACGNTGCSEQSIIANGTAKKYLLSVFGADRNIPGRLEFGGADLGDGADNRPWLWSTGSSIVDDETWHHIAVTYDAGKIKFYIDGKKVSTRNTIGEFGSTTQPLYIGGVNNWRIVDGLIDEVRIWNTVRSKSDIQSTMYQTLEGNEIGLVGYWQFDENTGTTANDKTSNNNHGVFKNGAARAQSGISSHWVTDIDTAVNGQLFGFDSDGDNLTYSLVDDNGGAAVLNDADLGTFTYTPTATGTHTFTYKVNDGTDDSNIGTAIITVPSLIVDSTSDVNDGDYATGQNTLREAIINAKAGDTITFDSSLTGKTIALDHELRIDKNITIDGGDLNIKISGQDSTRLFNIVAGTVALTNLTLQNGYADNGGALEIKGASTQVTVQNITFDSNQVTVRGGAIRIRSSANIIIKASTFVNNSADTAAGALGCLSSATTKIYNSTFFNNNSNVGAAINSNECGLLEIYNSTLHNNIGSHTLRDYTGTVPLKLYNTIISGTQGGIDCKGSLTVQTNTLIQDGTCEAIIMGDPKLSTALENHGGNTQTLALLAGSPAVNAGDNATCETKDQRGLLRSDYQTCDIGAYELIPIPTAPTNLTPTIPSVSDLTQGLTLSWTDSFYEEEYSLIRDKNAAVTLAPNTNSYTDTNVTCDESYSYTFKTKNSYGESDEASISVTMPTCPIPQTPTDLIADTSVANQISISWTDNNDYEDQYILQRDGKEVATLNANSVNYLDNAVTCGKSYQYALKASNQYGESVFVSTTAQMPTCPDTTPEPIVPKAPNVPLNFVAAGLSDTQIKLTWLDESSIEKGYKIERDGVRIETVKSDTESFIDENLKCETAYNYALYAYNSIGESAQLTATATTLACPPNVPTGFDASVTGEAITLAWQDVESETAYLISRDLNVEFELATNVTTLVDDASECGQTYQYSLIAINEDTASKPANLTVETNPCSEMIQPIVATDPNVQQPDPADNPNAQQPSDQTKPIVPASPIVESNIQQPISPDELDIQQPINPVVPTISSDTQTNEPITEPLIEILPPTPVILVSNNSDVSATANLAGQTVTDINIQAGGSVSNATLQGEISNQGLASNIEVAHGAIIVGGRLSGFNTNQGTLQDITITPYSEVSGGSFSGTVDNNGTLQNPTITPNSIVFSSTGEGEISGAIQNQGTIQGTLQLTGTLIGGKISGTISAPANATTYISAVEILPGTVLENVTLSPNVQLPDDVILINVKRPTSLADLNIDTAQLDSLDADSMAKVEPAALNLFTPHTVGLIPAAAFSNLNSEQLAAFEPEALTGLTNEQFSQIPVESLASLNSQSVQQLPTNIIQNLTVEQVQALNLDMLKQDAQAISKLLTNLTDAVLNDVGADNVLPQGWTVDAETGNISIPAGQSIVYKSFKSSVKNTNLPDIPDFSSGFGIAGSGTALLDNVNAGLSQTQISNGDASDLLKEADLSKFELSQKPNGILNVAGTEQYSDLLFAFLPDTNGIHTVEEDKIKVGLSQIEGGFFQITMPNKQRFTMYPSPDKPEQLGSIFGESATISIHNKGEVFINYIENGQQKNLITTFDAFVSEDSEAQTSSFSLDNNTRSRFSRAIREGRVVFSDGSVQSIYPAVLYPEILIGSLEQFGAENVVYNADSTFNLSFEGQSILLLPTFDTQVRGLDVGERITASLSIDNNELIYSVQDTVANQLVTCRLVISFE